MITVRYSQPIESASFSRDGMDSDSVVLDHEEIEFEITFEEFAQYFAPKGFTKWTKERKEGFVEAIKETYFMDALDEIIEDEDFKHWAYSNFY